METTEDKVEMVDWVDESVQMGTPTMVLLPASNYFFKVLDGQYKITITREGLYHELDPTFFAKEDGAFNLYDEKTSTMYLPAITKVLFGEKKYPDLTANQMFAPIALVFNEETVDILGQILEIKPVTARIPGSTATKGD